MQEEYFENRALNQKTGIHFDISKMTSSSYEQYMHDVIKSAVVLDHSKDPCTDKDFIPDNNKK